MSTLDKIQNPIKTEDEQLDALNSIVDFSNSLSSKIGDLDNHSNTTNPSFISSISGSLGDLSKLDPELPFGEVLTNFTETFSPSVSNDFYLSLEPISDITVIDGSNSYIMVDKSLMSDVTHYSISGRKLSFFRRPANTFSINYKGKFPTVPGIDKYTPNTYPSLSSIKTGHQQKSVLTQVSSDITEVDIQPLTRIGSVNLSNPIYSSLPDKLKPFITPSGGVKAPTSDVSVWIFSDNRFQKIDDASVYLMSDSKFRFQTDIPIPLDSFIVLSVNSWTVADSISFLTKFLLTHSHNGTELGSPISHSNLSDLKSERYIPDAKEYSESKFIGDSHPQYFNRDGYIADNEGNFNNAILGDVLIGSSNDYNLYNNILDNSRKLFFGSVSNGSSLMYDHLFSGLRVFGANNGIKLVTHSDQSNPDNAYGIGLDIDGNKIYSTGDRGGASNILNIESKEGIAKFVSSLGGLSTIIAKGINAEKIEVSGAVVTTGDKGVRIGDVEFNPKDGNVIVESERQDANVHFDVNLSTDRINVDELNPKITNISDGSVISFGVNDTDGKIKTEGGAVTISGSHPVSYTTSGKNTGLLFNKDQTRFLNVYTASENGGLSSETDHNTYFESGSGEIYFLKDSTRPQTALGKTYAFGSLATADMERVDNLVYMPRSDLNAGKGDFYNVDILASSLKERRGLNIGGVAAVYATGNDTECPPGWLVLESKNGVVFVDSRSGAIDCQTMVYSEVTTGDIKVFGNASVDKNLGVSDDIDVGGTVTSRGLTVREIAEIGSLTVDNDARFTGSVSFTESVTVNEGIDVGGSITSKNKITSNEFEVQSSSIFNGPASFMRSINIDGDVIADGTFTTGGDITSQGKITAESARVEELTVSSVKAINTIDARGGIESAGRIVSTGNIETDADVLADGGRFTTQVKTVNLIVEQDQTVGNELYVKGRLQATGDVTLGSSPSDRVNFNGDAIFNNTKTSFIGTLDVTDSASFKSDLDVTGQATFASVIKSKAGLELEGPISSDSTAEFTSINAKESLYVNNDSVIGGRIDISGAAKVSGGIAVTGDLNLGSANDNMIVSADAHFSNNKNTFSGEVLMTEKVIISGDAIVNSKMNIEGNLNTAGNLKVDGLAELVSLTATGQSKLNGGLTVEKQTQLDTLFVSGKSIFDNDITSSGELHISGNITSLITSNATFGSLTALAGVNQSDNKSLNQFAGNTVFNNGVSVSGDLSVKGVLSSGSAEMGVVIEGNSVKLNGDTSLIRSNSASIDKITGRSKKVVAAIGSKSTGTSQVASQLSNKSYTIMDNVFVEDSMVNNGDIFCTGTLYVGDMQVIEVPGAEKRFNESSTVMNIRARRAKYAP